MCARCLAVASDETGRQAGDVSDNAELGWVGIFLLISLLFVLLAAVLARPR